MLRQEKRNLKKCLRSNCYIELTNVLYYFDVGKDLGWNVYNTLILMVQHMSGLSLAASLTLLASKVLFKLKMHTHGPSCCVFDESFNFFIGEKDTVAVHTCSLGQRRVASTASRLACYSSTHSLHHLLDSSVEHIISQV